MRIILAAAVGLAVVVLTTVGLVVVLNRPAALPGEFAGGTLLTPTEQYARDLADGYDYAKQYGGSPEKYREYLEQALIPVVSSSEEGTMPVQITAVLVGRYDRAGTPINLALNHHAVNEELWDSYVQQRALDYLLSTDRVVVAEDTYCRPAPSSEEYLYRYCVRIGSSGFWTAVAYSDKAQDNQLPGLTLGDLGKELAQLR